ncbi:MAG: hypothetical protein LC793_24050 [Thermomicrobia bacterium]|nr:hypothetical protein [Thermomicrobia bacterium]
MMPIPDSHREFFEHILAAGASGNLAMVEVMENESGQWRTAFVIYMRDATGGYDVLPFALFDPLLAEKVSPPAIVQEVYRADIDDDN